MSHALAESCSKSQPLLHEWQKLHWPEWAKSSKIYNCDLEQTGHFALPGSAKGASEPISLNISSQHGGFSWGFIGMDQVKDTGFTQFYEMSQLYGELPDYVKIASQEETFSPRGLPSSSYADVIGRKFPVHTKAACLVSALYF